jgi:acyl-CoA thioester hydrolase
MYSTHTQHLIPFHDVDSMMVVWHGHYVKYLELARCDFLDSIGYNYKAMRDSGFAWPVVDMRIKFVKPLEFGQSIDIECYLMEWEYRLKLGYIIRDSVSGIKITKAYTVQVAVNNQTKELCFESPPVLAEALSQKLTLNP